MFLDIILTAAVTIAVVWLLVKMLPPSITKFLMILAVITSLTVVIVEFWPLMTWVHWIPARLSVAFENHVRPHLDFPHWTPSAAFKKYVWPHPEFPHWTPSANFEKYVWTPFFTQDFVYLTAGTPLLALYAIRILRHRFLCIGQSKTEKGLKAALDKARLELAQAEFELLQLQAKATEAQSELTRAMAKLVAFHSSK